MTPVGEVYTTKIDIAPRRFDIDRHGHVLAQELLALLEVGKSLTSTLDSKALLRKVVQTAFLYVCYHRHVPPLDELIALNRPLTSEEIRLSNVPRVKDVETILTLVADLGGSYSASGDTVALRVPKIRSDEAS